MSKELQEQLLECEEKNRVLTELLKKYFELSIKIGIDAEESVAAWKEVKRVAKDSNTADRQYAEAQDRLRRELDPVKDK